MIADVYEQESQFLTSYEYGYFVLYRDVICEYLFSFNGISCVDFDLMLYDFGGSDDSERAFASTVDITDDILGQRHTPYLYSAYNANRLIFNITFGINDSRIGQDEFLTRTEINAISRWLTGRKEYCWLTIDHKDGKEIKYRCMITGLKLISFGKKPYGFEAEVTCDGPFGYCNEQEQSFTIDGMSEITVNNISSLNAYTRPYIEFQITSGTGFSIANLTDGGRALSIVDLPAGVKRVYVDNDRYTVTCDTGQNIYSKCNFKWIRLKRGENTLSVMGYGVLTIRYVNPVNVCGPI